VIRRAYDAGMAYDEVLADRVRERLSTSAGAAAKRMFGGIAFLIRGNMTVGVHGDELIARISPHDTDAALAEPGVRVLDITGKPKRGWILLAASTSTMTILTHGWPGPRRMWRPCRPNSQEARWLFGFVAMCAGGAMTARAG